MQKIFILLLIFILNTTSNNIVAMPFGQKFLKVVKTTLSGALIGATSNSVSTGFGLVVTLPTGITDYTLFPSNFNGRTYSEWGYPPEILFPTIIGGGISGAIIGAVCGYYAITHDTNQLDKSISEKDKSISEKDESTSEKDESTSEKDESTSEKDKSFLEKYDPILKKYESV